MSASLGEKLRQAREERGISIGEVAEQTRISSLYLKSIEDDNYKPLPGGIFNKGFVKAYAKYVGLDEQEALQDYARIIAQAEQNQEEFTPRYRPEVLTDEHSVSSLVPTIIFAAIILGLMTGGILFVVSYIQNRPDQPAAGNSQSNPSATNQNPAQADATPDAATAARDIQVEFRALSDRVSVTSTVDGTLAYDEVAPGSPKTYNAESSVKLRYYRGFADRVEILLNGKPVEPPQPPSRGNIEFEINRENVARIFETGRIVEPPPIETPVPTATSASTPQPTETVAPSPTRTATPRPSPTSPRPAFTPQPTPRRTPTPIVVGSPETRRSPN